MLIINILLLLNIVFFFTTQNALLRNGAKINLKDNNGKTALDFAIEYTLENDYVGIIEILEKNGAKKGIDIN